MSLDVGARLGPYEILSVVGMGGMGEVYKARDTRLNRSVAIKILPPIWAHDPVMQQRFEREAKTIAGLNHPHICTLHDVGHEEATDTTPAVDFLVMEHLEGETLSERLEKGALPVREALKIALAIADALDKAHKQGVVHRDLKPSNVMLTKRGAKLLDFGLAKPSGVLQAVGAIEGRSMLPTAANVTTPGTIVGTVQYMAPEQLEGREADARTDIFSFGVVLYEMLTGKKAFQGKSKTLLMSAILTSEPKPLAHVQPMTPAALDHLVRRCLAKDPEERWQTAHDLLVQLRWVAGLDTRLGASGAALTRRQRLLRGLGVGALVLAGGLAFPSALYLWKSDPPEEFQFRSPVIGISPPDIAVSPDGKNVAFVARPNANEPSALYVRPTRSTASRRIAGTEEAAQPFWAPDSKSIGFVAGGVLRRVEAAGGSPQDVTPAPDFAGGTWSRGGTILFGSTKGVLRVSAEGGIPEPVTGLDKSESGHFWPRFLPDDRHFVYSSWSKEPGRRAVFAASLDSKDKNKDRNKVMAAESNVAYAAPGYLVFHREASVFALPFDASRMQPSGEAGEAFHLADGVAYNPADGRGNFDVSQTGDLIYFQGVGGPSGRGQTAQGVLGWAGRGGAATAASEVGQYGDFDLSIDGRRIAVTRQDTGAGGADIWVIDWQRAAVPYPLTRDAADDINPVWSPDGKRIAYTTYRKGNADVYVRNSDATGPETPLLESAANEQVEGWSFDGHWLLYLSGPENSRDIYALPMSPDGKPSGEPRLIPAGGGRKDEPQLSRDSKWLAYTSNESGAFQVYIVAFPTGEPRVTVTKDGGGQPRWKADGKRLYYRLPLDASVMSVDVITGAGIEVSVPQFEVRTVVSNQITRDATRHQLGAVADGTRFLIRVPIATARGPGSSGAANGITLFFTGRGQGIPALNTRGGGAREAGRGGLPANANVNGLTVVLNWTKALNNTKK